MASTVALLAVGSVPLVRADEAFRNVGVRVVAVAVLALLAAVVNGWPPLVPLAVGLVGGTYAAQLALDDSPVDVAAPAVAVGLFLAAELAYWSLDERHGITGEPGESLRRTGFVALLGLGAFLVGASLLALADAVRVRGIGLDVLGATAAVAALVTILLATLTERRQTPSAGS